jgi:predicted ester cyclase
MHAAGEDTAVTELVARGTHRGEFLGIAPTGRRVEIPVCNVVEVQGGKILAERDYFDTGLVLQQLGVAAGPASR